MEPILLLAAGHSTALDHTCSALQKVFPFADKPSENITHVLLPVPSFEGDGSLKGGGDISKLLETLSKEVTIIGGNLNHPALAGYHSIDLLQDPNYLAMNARITAHCAISLATQQLDRTFDDTSILIIGWGRIGKCLGQLLQGTGASITIAARKETDRATLTSLGYSAIDTKALTTDSYTLVFNTVPEMILPHCKGNTFNIDLASAPGLSGENIIWARGLPNKLAPVSSGMLIAQTVESYLTGGKP